MPTFSRRTYFRLIRCFLSAYLVFFLTRPLYAEGDELPPAFNNESLRVIAVQLSAGETRDISVPFPHLLYMLSKADLKIENSSGSKITSSNGKGDVIWNAQAGELSLKNVGTTPTEFLIIEVKCTARTAKINLIDKGKNTFS